MLLTWLYTTLYTIVLMIYMPFFLYRKGLQNVNLKNRFSISLPRITRKHKDLIWVHAVSMGEMKAVSELVKHFSGYDIIVSTMTVTGFKAAQSQIPQALTHFYMPFDIPIVIHRYIKFFNPQKIILSETDLWWNFLRLAKKNSSSIFVVNGKLSGRSFDRWSKWPYLAKKLYGLVDHFYVQTNCDQERLTGLGIPNASILVTGNLKYDAQIYRLSDIEKEELKKLYHINRPLVVLSCTHAPEEEELVSQLYPLLDQIKVFVVPRHPERYEEVKSLFAKRGFEFSSVSSGMATSQLVVFDQMYGLTDLYQLDAIVVLAGSFSSHVGGHNLIEPIKCGALLLYGPHTSSQNEMRMLIEKYHAGIEITVDSLRETIEALLQNHHQSEALLNNSQHLLKNIQGSVDKTLKNLTLDFSLNPSSSLKPLS